MSLDEEVQSELRALDEAHRRRVPRIVDSAPGPHIVLDGRPVLNFASNDYLGLAGDPRLARAAAAALDGGTGATASRLIVGNHRAHVALERALADWQRTGAARLFNAGYAANVGVLSALLHAGDVVFSDELNHASIIDGCRLSRAEIAIFPHRDYAALASLLAPRRGRRRIVVSESLFSMDGDFADVAQLAALCKQHDAALMLDEAHAIGAIGPEGRGVAASLGVVPDLLVGTFGKAFGAFGAFVATSPAIVELMWNRARSFVFSTGLPPSVPASTLAALEIIRSPEGDDRRRRLAHHGQWLRENVARAGGTSPSPIVPVMIGADAAAMSCTERLLSAGIFVQGIRPPTVAPGTARLRIGLSAAHTPADLEQLATSLVSSL